MYDILLDGKPLWYPGDEEAVVMNPELHQILNDSGYVQLTVPLANPLYEEIHERKSMITVQKDGKEIFAGEVRECTENKYIEKKVYAVGELSFLLDSIQPQGRYQDYTPAQFLQALLDRHNAQVEERKKFILGVVTVTDPNDSIYRYTNYEDTLTAIRKKLCEPLNGYLRIRKENDVRYLDLVTLDDYGKTCTQPIKFGVNLLDYAKKTNAEKIATAVLPLGKKLDAGVVEGLDSYVTIESVNDGVDYVYSEDGVKEFGWVKVVKKWDDVTEPSNLKRKALEWLVSVQFADMVLQLKALDLSMLNSNIDSFEIGDSVNALAEPYGMDAWFPVQEKVTYFQKPENNSITLSNTVQKTFTQKTSDANLRLETEIPEKSPLLEQAKQNASNLITSATNGYIVLKMDDQGNPSELLIMDTKDIATAKKVWRWNINGLAYSSNGYKGPYAIAMTMDGRIVADFITSGTMLADRIFGGTLSLGGVNNQNGVAMIYNSEGKIVGWMNSEGVVVRSEDEQDIAWMKEGYAWYYKNGQLGGSVGACGLDMNGETLHGLMLKTHDDLIAFVRSDGKTIAMFNPNHKPIGSDGYTELFYLGGHARFNGTIYGNQGIEIAGEMKAESVKCNKMSVQGGASQDVEWVWNADMQRWCLCTIT